MPGTGDCRAFRMGRQFIIGMSYQLFRGFVGRARTALRFPSLDIAELSFQRPRSFILFAFNADLIAIVVAFVFRPPTLGAGRRMPRVGSSRPVRRDHLLDAEFYLPCVGDAVAVESRIMPTEAPGNNTQSVEKSRS